MPAASATIAASRTAGQVKVTWVGVAPITALAIDFEPTQATPVPCCALFSQRRSTCSAELVVLQVSVTVWPDVQLCRNDECCAKPQSRRGPISPCAQASVTKLPWPGLTLVEPKSLAFQLDRKLQPMRSSVIPFCGLRNEVGW